MEGDDALASRQAKLLGHGVAALAYKEGRGGRGARHEGGHNGHARAAGRVRVDREQKAVCQQQMFGRAVQLFPSPNPAPPAPRIY
jgi:hypothetical protein